jgi:molybdopterin synthase sulfur carrier subunit
MPLISLTPHLTRFFPDLAPTHVSATTIAEAVEALDRIHPGIAGYITDDSGALRQHVNIFLADKLIADRRALSDPVGPDDAIFIMQALSGG